MEKVDVLVLGGEQLGGIQASSFNQPSLGWGSTGSSILKASGMLLGSLGLLSSDQPGTWAVVWSVIRFVKATA